MTAKDAEYLQAARIRAKEVGSEDERGAGLWPAVHARRSTTVPDCRYALKIKPENRVYFQSQHGGPGKKDISPARVCNPMTFDQAV